MDSQSTRTPLPAGPFESALSVLQRRTGTRRLGTGNPELDGLLGGLEPGLFYLFYGSDDDGLPDGLLHRLIVEAVKGEGARAVYLLCGNYRRSRTTMDPELVLSHIEEAGLDAVDALSRIHIVCAFSERHLMRAPDLVEELLNGHDGFALVAVQQIAKIFYGRRAVRFEEPTEFTGTVSRLKAMCSERGVVLAATTRTSGLGGPIPAPEGGSYLRHAANAIVYLRASRKGAVTAYVVEHPDSALTGLRMNLGGEETQWAG
jgi:hypothetical protein